MIIAIEDCGIVDICYLFGINNNMDVPEQTINSFFNQAVIGDFQRDFLFRINDISISGGLSLTPSELLYARGGKLPGRQIINKVVKYGGQEFNIPGAHKFEGSDSYEIEFYCPEDSSIRELLLNESNRTFGNVFGIAGSGEAGGSIASANSRMVLLQLDKNLNAIYKYELIGCSIRNVGEMEYKISEGDGEVQTFRATFAYHFFVRTAVGDDLVTPIDN